MGGVKRSKSHFPSTAAAVAWPSFFVLTQKTKQKKSRLLFQVLITTLSVIRKENSPESTRDQTTLSFQLLQACFLQLSKEAELTITY